MQTHSAKAIPCLKEPWFKPHKSKMLGLLGYWQNSRTFEELPQALQTHLLSLKATPGTPLSEPLKELTQEKASIFLADFQNLHRINFTEPLVETRPPTMYDWFAEMGWIDKRGNTRGRWNDEPLAMTEAVRFLVDKVLKKDPRDIMKKDFKSNCLDGLLNGYYNNSPYAAISEAYPKLNIKQWEMFYTPIGFYETKKNRISAVKWLVKKLNKDPRDITFEDFHSNRLGGLLSSYYNNSPYAALKEAGYNFHPWEMLKTPQGFYNSKKNRTAAIKWLVEEKLKKDPRDIKQEDFKSNCLDGLLNGYYNNSPYAAISEAYPELNIKQWEMSCTPSGFYETKKNRIAAVKWLVEKLNKDPRDIRFEDFKSNRLGSLLNSYYNGCPYAALKEAGYNFHPWEMLKTPQGFFDSKKNRISAVKWLVKKLNKDPRNITVEAFKSNRLGGLLNSYYNNSPYAAISEAYPKLNIKQWEMFYTPTGFYETKKNRTSAVKWLVKKLNKDPRDITVEAFKSNRLRGLLASYYSDSPYEALKEAGLVTEADYDYMHNAGARAWKTRREKEASENAQTP